VSEAESAGRFLRALRSLRKLAPWAIAAGILYYLFSQVPIAEAWAAMRAARLELFLPVMLAAVMLWFLVDSAAFAFLFSRFNARLSWAEARSLRGVTYLATPVNWNLGTAAVILHLRTSKEIGALDSTSTMFFYQTIDGMILAAYVLLGVLLLPESPETISLRNIALGFEGFQIATLAILMNTQPEWRWLARIRGVGLFRTHRMATLRDLFYLFAIKGLYFAVFVGVFWLGSVSFGLELPLVVATAATPAILMAGAIPITPAGLGTQQAAMLYFFSPYGDEAAILAFGLTFPVALILFRCLLGLRYLSDLPKLRRAVADRQAEA
jgi:uncharacterized membrane protein YbhN (UPF0104 family)